MLGFHLQDQHYSNSGLLEILLTDTIHIKFKLKKMLFILKDFVSSPFLDMDI